MNLYLPIAEMSVSVLLLIGLGGIVGFVSGLFGVGGGFLLTPALILMGIPPSIAVASQASQIAASALSGALSYWQQKRIDIKLGNFLLVGGTIGACFGIVIFSIFRSMGQLDVVISVSFVVLLSTMGLLLISEHLPKVKPIFRISVPFPKLTWVKSIYPIYFPTSDIRVSALLVLLLGWSIGFLGTILGIGGAFVLIPALVYGLKVPTRIAVGTALYQTVITMSFASFLHAVSNHTVDIILALLLMIGGVYGAQFGAQMGQKVKAEHLRLILGVLILSVAARFLVVLVQEPTEYFVLFTSGA